MKRLAHAHEQIKRADEQLTRLSEQLAKMERDDAHPPSAETWPATNLPARTISHAEPARTPSPPGRPALRTLVGLSAGGVHRCRCPSGFAVILWRRATLIVARWAPQPVSTPSLPPENLPSPAQPAPSTVQVAAAEAAPAASNTHRKQQSWLRPHRKAPRRQHPQRFPITRSCCKRSSRDLANLERNIEQLKTNQQQMASDNSKAIGELKASQEEIKRVLAKVSEQNPPRTSRRTASDAAGSDLAQARADAAAGESAAAISEGSGSTTIGSRRFGDHEAWALQQRLDAIRRAVIAFSHLSLPSHPTCQFREAGAACSCG